MPDTTIREQIVVAMEAVLIAMKKPTYAFRFEGVQRSPFKSLGAGKKRMAAIFDETDQRTPDTDPVVRVALKIAIELMVYIESGETPSTQLNLVVGEVERALMVDRTFGKLAIDVFLDRTEHDIEGRFDKYAESTMFLTVDFRHNNADPRAAV